MLFFPSQAKKQKGWQKAVFRIFYSPGEMPFVAFYVLCHHGKAQNNELLSTACVLQVILYNWDWKTKPPGTIQQSRAKRPGSPHRFSAKLSTHSSIQSNETRWSPPSHRKRIFFRVSPLQPLGAPRITATTVATRSASWFCRYHRKQRGSSEPNVSLSSPSI